MTNEDKFLGPKRRAFHLTFWGYVKSDPTGEDLGEGTKCRSHISPCCLSAIASKRRVQLGGIFILLLLVCSYFRSIQPLEFLFPPFHSFSPYKNCSSILCPSSLMAYPGF